MDTVFELYAKNYVKYVEPIEFNPMELRSTIFYKSRTRLVEHSRRNPKFIPLTCTAQFSIPDQLKCTKQVQIRVPCKKTTSCMSGPRIAPHQYSTQHHAHSAHSSHLAFFREKVRCISRSHRAAVPLSTIAHYLGPKQTFSDSHTYVQAIPHPWAIRIDGPNFAKDNDMTIRKNWIPNQK